MQRTHAATLKYEAEPTPELFDRAQGGDTVARDQLVGFYMPLAKRIARNSQTRLVESEDLEQVASLALVLAIDRFDHTRGAAFSSFAVPTISGEIKRHLRDRSWTVRVPRSLQENGQRVKKLAAKLTADEGRAPTVGELAASAGLSEEDVLEAMEASQALGSVSLDSPGAGSGEDMSPMLDRLGVEDPGFARVERLAAMAPALAEIPPRDRLVLYLRFVEDRTQSEIAAQIGVSQMQVSRLLRAMLERFRADLAPVAPR